jgi:hypothetical protein
VARKKIKSNDVEKAVALKKASSGYDDIPSVDGLTVVESGVTQENAIEKKENVIDFPSVGTGGDLEAVEFIIESKGKDSEDYICLKFVTRALDLSSTRSFTKIIKIERDVNDKTIAVCSDGKRIHYSQLNADIPVGSYSMRKMIKGNAIILRRIPERDLEKYPNWEKVIRMETEVDAGEISIETPSLRKNHIGKLTCVLYHVLKQTARLINMGFLADLERGIYKILYDKGSKSRPLKFVLNARKEMFAFIQPMDV